jgi:hypothetical protein
MTTVVVHNLSGDACRLAVSASTTLRDVQQGLCHFFRRPFPAMKATLVIDGRSYSEFDDLPFRQLPSEASVVFSATDDPFFYDVMDRRPKRLLRCIQAERTQD